MYSEILKANVRKILGRTILRKCSVKFSLTFGNNLKKRIPKFWGKINYHWDILSKFDKFKIHDENISGMDREIVQKLTVPQNGNFFKQNFEKIVKNKNFHFKKFSGTSTSKSCREVSFGYFWVRFPVIFRETWQEW